MVLGRVAPASGVVKDHAVAVEYSPMTTPTTTHDLVIRGGLIVDGTGAPARRGDVAVQGGRLAEVDRFSELARAANRPVTLVSLRHNQEGRMPDRPDPSEGRGPGRVLRAA
jgi:hypothetical protein